jgi:transposase
LRTTLVQLAWLWLRHQPQSALAMWFKERVNRNGGRLKKTTIVALARKLLVALWKYVTAGVVIEGAVMKTPDDRRSTDYQVLQNLISSGGSGWTNR